MQKPTVPLIAKQYPNFKEPDGSLPRSQRPATCLYPEPDGHSLKLSFLFVEYPLQYYPPIHARNLAAAPSRHCSQSVSHSPPRSNLCPTGTQHIARTSADPSPPSLSSSPGTGGCSAPRRCCEPGSARSAARWIVTCHLTWCSVLHPHLLTSTHLHVSACTKKVFKFWRTN
jgi:hypothetical protein